MKKLLLVILLFIPTVCAAQNPPIYIAFLWHMHQPIYFPGETITETEAAGHYDYSVIDIHNVRQGPYTDWPADAVQMGINAGMPHFGAQVSFSGSLVQNLNELEAAGNSNFQNWKAPWQAITGQTTALGNPRLDLVAFGAYHPLLALIDPTDMQHQINAHRHILQENDLWQSSKGMFPPENAFSTRMIPTLVEADIEWVLVDNIHFERACDGYPFNTGGNLYEPNPADVRNPDPGDWQQLNGLWAPTPVSLQWAHQPHYAAYIDPNSGTESHMIVVPASRYLGVEDGRGGFGALNYEGVMSQFEDANTDPDHPILIVLHHDGDNHGGGTDAYYHYNFQNFVNWLAANPDRFVCTTIQDYLDQFPPAVDDRIHVEPGSWSGADNGDPEFKKWNGDPDPNTGYSPDRNSWGVMTAAKNVVSTASAIDPTHPDTQLGREYLLTAEASDYWYWDYEQGGIWDAHPTRGANLALSAVLPIAETGPDLVGPTIYLPQREPYNPGGLEWTMPQPADFTVWTYAYDLSGIQTISLTYRLDLDGVNSPETTDNETYIGGSEVTAWETVPMSAEWIPPQTDPQPQLKAHRYTAEVAGLNNKWVDYYVEAVDSLGHISRAPIQHVWVGNLNGGGSGYTMDGQVDESAQLLAQNDVLSLYADWNGTDLYVAAPAAADLQGDVFIFLAADPDEMMAAPWAKAGQVAAWDAFLGNESTNNWSGWFDQTAQVTNFAGEFVEGTIRVEQEFGTLPEHVHLALGLYATNDSDPLLNQLPAGNEDGHIDPAEWLTFSLEATHVEDDVKPHLKLCQNYPNPWFLSPAKGHPSTTIAFNLPSKQAVTLRIYNTAGQLVKTLLDGTHSTPAGTHEVTWDGRNEQGLPVSSGVYFYRLEASATKSPPSSSSGQGFEGGQGDVTQTRRMVLLR